MIELSRGGGRGPRKNALRKIGMRPLRETYPNTQISFSREYNGAHKLTYKEHECQTSKLWVQPKQFNNFIRKSEKKKKNETKTISQCLNRQRKMASPWIRHHFFRLVANTVIIF